MVVRATLRDDGQTISRDVEAKRLNTKLRAEVNDCPYCLYYLGKAKVCGEWFHVCNMDICPAEAAGYDARTYKDTPLQEVIA